MSAPSDSDKNCRGIGRLRKRREFDRVFAQSAVTRGRRVTVHMRHSEGEQSRLGIVVSRRVGGAVQRNRFKRLVREAFRTEAGVLTQGWDVVVVVRSSKDDGPGPIAEDLRRAFEASKEQR